MTLELTASGHAELRSDDRTVVRSDGDEVERHDFHLRRVDGGWRCRTLASCIAAEAAVRWITGVELLRAGGLLLHASSVIIGHGLDERGHLFLGPSGAGKTTIATECGAARILSDEVSIIAPVDDQWMVYPSPFWGLEERGRAGQSARLEGVWLLSGFETTATQPVSAANAALGVFNRVVSVDAGAQTAELALGAIDHLIDAVSVSGLSWSRGESVRSLLTSPAVSPPRAANEESNVRDR